MRPLSCNLVGASLLRIDTRRWPRTCHGRLCFCFVQTNGILISEMRFKKKINFKHLHDDLIGHCALCGHFWKNGRRIKVYNCFNFDRTKQRFFVFFFQNFKTNHKKSIIIIILQLEFLI